MKKQVFLVLALSALLLTSCGGKPSGPQIEDLGTKDFHTELMNSYLGDTWDSILTYVPKVNAEDSSYHNDQSQPNPIKLEFDEVEDSDVYFVQIANNAEFTDAKQVEVTEKFYNLYNAELGQEYYFRASDA